MTAARKLFRQTEPFLDNPDVRYRFSAHKEAMIELIARVARISVETMRIVAEMRAVQVGLEEDKGRWHERQSRPAIPLQHGGDPYCRFDCADDGDAADVGQ